MAIVGAAAVLGFQPASSVTLPADVEQYLLKVAGFSTQETAALEQGTVIARVAAGATDTEVMVVAAVKIQATRAQTVAYYGQMIAYVDGVVTTAFGRFSTPPRLADVGTLALEADEVAQLRSCRPGNCDLRIGGRGLEAIRSSIDWKAGDAAEQVNAAVREATVAYVSAYVKDGDAALVTYDDRSQPVSLRQQWVEILAASPYFKQYTGALRDYLAEYPRRTLPGGRDVLYWVKEDYSGLKPVISIIHGVIYEDAATPGRTVVAQKQLYASHYYDGSLAVALVVGAAEAPSPVTYLVYANRSRGDLLKGGFGGLKRNIARGQARSAAEQTLGTIKQMLESAPAK